MISRRNFLQKSSIVSLAPVLPTVFGRTASSATPESDNKILVVIQLDGGNDGLNTVVPFADDEYAKARTKIQLPEKKLHKLNDQIGLHPAMKAAKELFDDGRFSIIHGVGYPNPNRSHFESMRIWQSAALNENNDYGWLGRTMDQQKMKGSNQSIFVGQQETPLALWGRRAESINISNASDLQLELGVKAFPQETKKGLDDTNLKQFVTKQFLSAYASANEFEQQQKKLKSGALTKSYPKTRLGQQLELISQIIKSGSHCRIFYTVQGGYDTHSIQQRDHASLLREYANSVKAFLDDAKAAGLDDRIVVMTFSEFGRRVQENKSMGTDHGTAGPVFLAGSPVKGGLIGDAPNLSDLVDGDLKVQLDFRSIYASILDQWLEIEPTDVLGGKFDQLSLFS